MSTASFSKSRLVRMHQVLSGHIEGQEMPGLVSLISRQDEVHVEALGALAFGDPTPMKRDTIFRIASITKPITAVAAKKQRELAQARELAVRILATTDTSSDYLHEALHAWQIFLSSAQSA